MLGTELIGWFAEVLGKRPDGVQVQPDRGRRIMPDLEVLQHPLSKWCHSKNSFRCDHITNRLPAEPSTPWNVRHSALHLPEGLCSMEDIMPCDTCYLDFKSDGHSSGHRDRFGASAHGRRSLQGEAQYYSYGAVQCTCGQCD